MLPTKWSLTTKRLIVVGLVSLFLLALYLLRPLVPPIALGMALAYLLKPVVDLLERRARFPRLLAVALVFLALLALLSLLLVTIVPWIGHQLARLGGVLQGLSADVAAFLSRPFSFLGRQFTPEQIFGDLPKTLQALVQPFARQTFSLLLQIPSIVVWVVTVLLVAFYLVKDAAQLRDFLDRAAPPGYEDELRRVREEIIAVWSQFFRGQLVLCIIIGLATGIAMTAVGLPNAALMGLVAGVLEVIPNFGPVVAAIPSLLIAFFQGSNFVHLSNPWFVLLVAALYIGIQQTENAFIVPRVLGRRLQLHPLVVFIGVLGGGLLFGPVGIFLAAPAIASLRVFFRYVFAKLLDREPFPPEPATARKEVSPGDIDAIFLDLDGTLIETDDEAVQRLSRRLRPLRWLLPARDLDRASRRVLMGVEGPASRVLGLLDRLGLDDNVLGLSDRLRRMRGVVPAPGFRGVDGAAVALETLSQRYRLAIVTTRSHREAEAFLAQEGLAGLVQVVTGRDDTWRIKPHPAPIVRTAQTLGVPVSRCLMVGDTAADIHSARAAGAHSAGVLCGFGVRRELEEAGADLILGSPAELASTF